VADGEFLKRLKLGNYLQIELIVACCWIIEEDFEWTPERVLEIAELIQGECKRLGQDAGITALELIAASRDAMLKKFVN
jgi:hypothetical protein